SGFAPPRAPLRADNVLLWPPAPALRSARESGSSSDTSGSRPVPPQSDVCRAAAEISPACGGGEADLFSPLHDHAPDPAGFGARHAEPTLGSTLRRGSSVRVSRRPGDLS